MCRLYFVCVCVCLYVSCLCIPTGVMKWSAGAAGPLTRDKSNSVIRDASAGDGATRGRIRHEHHIRARDQWPPYYAIIIIIYIRLRPACDDNIIILCRLNAVDAHM